MVDRISFTPRTIAGPTPAVAPTPTPAAAPAKTTARDQATLSAQARVTPTADPLASYPPATPRDQALADATLAAATGDHAGAKAAVIKALAADPSLDAQIDVAKRAYAMGEHELAGKVLRMLENHHVDDLAKGEMGAAKDIAGALGSDADLQAAFTKLLPGATGTVSDGMVSDMAKIARAKATLGETILPDGDPLAQRAQAILDRLAPGKFKAMVADDAEENANTAGDNTVLITTGLLKGAKSDDEIAFVLGHELSHVKAGDFRKTLALTGMQALTDMVADATKASDATKAAVSTAETNAANALDRQQELDADAAGLRLAASAGFDPKAGVAWMRRQAAEHPQLDRGDGQHPKESMRADLLEAQIQQEQLGG